MGIATQNGDQKTNHSGLVPRSERVLVTMAWMQLEEYTRKIGLICIVKFNQIIKQQKSRISPEKHSIPTHKSTTNPILPQEISSEIPPNPFPQPFPGHGLRGRRLRPGRAGNGAGGADPAAAEVGGCRVHLGASAHGMAALT